MPFKFSSDVDVAACPVNLAAAAAAAAVATGRAGLKLTTSLQVYVVNRVNSVSGRISRVREYTFYGFFRILRNALW